MIRKFDRRAEGTFPAFLGIGAQRAGTGWLYHNLKNHPDIWTAPVKELHYFDTLTKADSLSARLLSSAWWRDVAVRFLRDWVPWSHGTLQWDFRYYFGRRNDDWYTSLFFAAGKRKAGEITPAYSTLDSDTVAHIREIMPDIRIIFMMRDPLDRAWSHAINRLVGVDKLKFENIKEEQFIKHIDSEDSWLRTDYMRTIRNWERHFPTSQIFYGFYDDIAQRPESLISSIYRFLQVDPGRAVSDNMPRRRVKRQMGGKYEIPINVQIYAAEKYYGLLTDLSARFGNQTDTWLAKARSILENAGRSLPIVSPHPVKAIDSALRREHPL